MGVPLLKYYPLLPLSFGTSLEIQQAWFLLSLGLWDAAAYSPPAEGEVLIVFIFIFSNIDLFSYRVSKRTLECLDTRIGGNQWPSALGK